MKWINKKNIVLEIANLDVVSVIFILFRVSIYAFNIPITLLLILTASCSSAVNTLELRIQQYSCLHEKSGEEHIEGAQSALYKETCTVCVILHYQGLARLFINIETTYFFYPRLGIQSAPLDLSMHGANSQLNPLPIVPPASAPTLTTITAADNRCTTTKFISLKCWAMFSL